MEIEEPVVLARLPKALQENLHHKHGLVYGLTSGQKKKRHEVSVAVDGHSVSIYEVEHGSIRASYTVPPAASFVCGPSSIRVRTGKRTYTRYTYFAVKIQGHQRLECFEERFENNQSQDIVKSGMVMAKENGNVEFLEIVPELKSSKENSPQHTVHAIFQSGTLRRYSANLHLEYTSAELSEIAFERSNSILAARWLTPGDVRNSTLKHRPDLLASTDPTSDFLAVLYCGKHVDHATARIGIWSLPPSVSAFAGTQSNSIAAIVLFSLPESQLWMQEADLECSFSPRATSVLVTGVKGVVSYDFSQYHPRKIWEQQTSDHGLSSVQLNASFVLTSTAVSLAVHDTRYDSSQAALDLTRIGKKRKREAGDSQPSRGLVRIIGFFPQLQKLVTMRRNHLLSFGLTGGRKESLLIDSLGYGVPDQLKVRQLAKTVELQIGIVDDLSGIASGEWSSLQQKLVEAAEVGDAAGFEATALKAVQNPDSLNRLSEAQIEFFLSKVFVLVDEGSTDVESGIQERRRIQVALAAYTLITMLIEHGAVTRHKLMKALRAKLHAGKAPHIEAGMISAALIESDTSFSLLKTWLDKAELADPAELVATVGILIRFIQAEAHAHVSEPSTDSMIQDVDGIEVDLNYDPEKRPGLSVIQSGSFSSSETEQARMKQLLLTALERLASYGPSAIAELLKSSLVQTEILTLVQILRQQLFEGRHTTSFSQNSYPSPPPSAHSSLEDRISEPVLSLNATSKMLLGCIDAIGPLGFFADEGQNEFMKNLVPDLKDETTLAMRGLEEASYLQGFLREMIRYAESIDKDAFAAAGASLDEDAAHTTQKPGTIITLYSEPSLDHGDIDTTTGMLPLSLHAENTISLRKMRKGGGQLKDRTLREVREMEHRNKGRYSLERLVL